MTGVEGHIGYVGPFPTKPGMNWKHPIASWSHIEYPIGDDKHHVGTSSTVHLDNAIGSLDIEYFSYRTGDQIGAVFLPINYVFFFFSPPYTASAFSRKHKPDQIVIAGFHKVGAITTKTGFGDGYVYKFDDITVSQVCER